VTENGSGLGPDDGYQFVAALTADRSFVHTFHRIQGREGLSLSVGSCDWAVRRHIGAVLLGWDATRASGLPAVSPETIAQAVREHPGFFLGFAGLDPRRSTIADDLLRCARLELHGVKLHPSAQGLRPDEPRLDAFWRRCQDLGLVVMVHTGTTGWGAGAPGGLGVELEPSRPLWLDKVAARFPQLRIIAAHAGWPWHEELLAIAMHKGNVWLDVSGWVPRYLPKVVWDYANGPLKHKVLFGTDYPFVDPGRILTGLREVLKPEVQPLVLGENAARVLGL